MRPQMRGFLSFNYLKYIEKLKLCAGGNKLICRRAEEDGALCAAAQISLCRIMRWRLPASV